MDLFSALVACLYSGELAGNAAPVKFLWALVALPFLALQALHTHYITVAVRVAGGVGFAGTGRDTKTETIVDGSLSTPVALTAVTK